jgi:hypothetical protein
MRWGRSLGVGLQERVYLTVLKGALNSVKLLFQVLDRRPVEISDRPLWVLTSPLRHHAKLGMPTPSSFLAKIADLRFAYCLATDQRALKK